MTDLTAAQQDLATFAADHYRLEFCNPDSDYCRKPNDSNSKGYTSQLYQKLENVLTEHADIPSTLATEIPFLMRQLSLAFWANSRHNTSSLDILELRTQYTSLIPAYYHFLHNTKISHVFQDTPSDKRAFGDDVKPDILYALSAPVANRYTPPAIRVQTAYHAVDVIINKPFDTGLINCFTENGNDALASFISTQLPLARQSSKKLEQRDEKPALLFIYNQEKTKGTKMRAPFFVARMDSQHKLGRALVYDSFRMKEVTDKLFQEKMTYPFNTPKNGTSFDYKIKRMYLGA